MSLLDTYRSMNEELLIELGAIRGLFHHQNFILTWGITHESCNPGKTVTLGALCITLPGSGQIREPFPGNSTNKRVSSPSNHLLSSLSLPQSLASIHPLLHSPESNDRYTVDGHGHSPHPQCDLGQEDFGPDRSEHYPPSHSSVLACSWLLLECHSNSSCDGLIKVEWGACHVSHKY